MSHETLSGGEKFRSAHATAGSVLFLASHVAPVLGLERVLIDLIEDLNTRIRPAVVCLGGTDRDREAVPSVAILGSPLRGSARILSVVRALRFARSIEDSAIVVVVGVWAAVPWLLATSPSQARRTIVWEHSLVSENIASSRSVRVLSWFARILYRRAGSIVAVSEPLAADISSWRQMPPVRVISNVVRDVPHVARSCAGDQVLLLSVGSMTTTKNHAALISAMAHLPAAYHLHLLGDGPERNTLIETTKRLGLTDRVVFEGRVPRQRVFEMLSRARLVVHPSVGETFGLVYVEAAQFGVPVVAVRNRAAAQMIPSLVPGVLTEKDSIAIASGVRKMVEFPPSAQDLAASETARAARFGAGEVAQMWVDHIASVKLNTVVSG